MSQEEQSPENSFDARIGRVADLVLRTAMVAVGAGLLYLIFGWDRRGGSVISVLPLYAVPVALLLFLSLASRTGPDRRMSMALLFLATVIPLYLAEAGLQYRELVRTSYGASAAQADSACPGRWRVTAVCLAAAATGAPFDSRSILDVIHDLEASGVEAWPSQTVNGDAVGAYVPRANLVREGQSLVADGRPLLPLSAGISGVHTVFCNEGGEWITYDADEHGFNNPSGLHRVGAVRIAVIGDSYVQGSCVRPEASIPGLLRTSLGPTLNLGFQGAGPLAELGMLREYAAPLRPEFVIWMFYEGNDLVDLARERNHGVLNAYLDPEFSQGLRESQAEVDSALRHWIAELRVLAEEEPWTPSEPQRRMGDRLVFRWLKFREVRRLARRAMWGRVGPEPVYTEEIHLGTATRFRDDVRSWGGTLLFVYLPSFRRIADPVANPHREAVLRMIEGLGIPILDMSVAQTAHEDPLSLYPFPVGSHFGEEGYRLVAEAVSRRIVGLKGAAH